MFITLGNKFASHNLFILLKNNIYDPIITKHIIQTITKLLSLIFEHCSDQQKINYYHHFKQLFIILLIIKICFYQAYYYLVQIYQKSLSLYTF